MRELLPIGHTFTEDFGPDTNSTLSRSRKVTYRVIAHKEVERMGMQEILEPILIQYSDGEIIQ